MLRGKIRCKGVTGTANLHAPAPLFAGLLAILLGAVRLVASQQVVHVVTADDLQQALLDPSVEHLVLTQHLDMSASNETLPFKVHGVQKTIRVRY